jgi:hypothetical protein
MISRGFIVVTLFEGSYHYGLAALTNSLYRNGYRGKIYAGFRGALPVWAEGGNPLKIDNWGAAHSFDVADDLELIFIPLNTTYHLTNYKPDFMLDVFEKAEIQSDGILYLDPDICLNVSWSYICEWLSCGLALCEDVNSPVSRNHPRRVGWKHYFANYGYSLSTTTEQYVNGGCVGVAKQYIRFLNIWKDLQEKMADEIGNLSASKLKGGKKYKTKGFANCFDCSDQDALNAAIAVNILPVSILGREAMGFERMQPILPHAIGSKKPWLKSFIWEAIKGHPPRIADSLYWLNVEHGPIKPYGYIQLKMIIFLMKISILISRFYKK